jgi:hypothetical protein
MLVVTMYTPDILPYLQYNIASVGAYCAKHGYEYRLIPSNVDLFNPRRTHHWSKVWAALNLIRQLKLNEWMFVMDADMLIQHPEIPLERFTREMDNEIIGVCDDKPNGGLINTGAMFFKAVDIMPDVLKTWWDSGEKFNYTERKYHEQSTLRKLILKDNGFSDLVKIFPINAFNSRYNQIHPQDFIAHYMAMPMEKRTHKMRVAFRELGKNKDTPTR